MSKQLQNPGPGQKDQKQRNLGSMQQDRDKYAREDNDNPATKKDEDQMVNEGGRSDDDDEGRGDLSKR
jgi:hypothetical protein